MGSIFRISVKHGSQTVQVSEKKKNNNNNNNLLHYFAMAA